MLRFWQKFSTNGHRSDEPEHFIELRNVVKAYKTEAGDFLALKGINLTINQGEFVGIIGKSGSGKSTLINMLTGIDRPTSGEIIINKSGIHKFDEGQMARWRGRNQGVIFQFFQLLPTLTVVENVMLPMDFCNMYNPRERQERAMHLLELVDVAKQAHKLPSQISGGQQQRVAIARALANDPPMIMADEPTGNLDSRTAHQVFNLFEKLVAEGKTFLMVTHDDDLARQVNRTIVIADGEIVNEWLVKALPTLSQEMLVRMTRKLEFGTYEPGEPIVEQGAEPDNFYIICKGGVVVQRMYPDGQEVWVDSMGPGQFFGEIALLDNVTRRATVRAAQDGPVEVAILNRDAFVEMINESTETHEVLRQAATQRNQQIEVVR
jgi:ABC-type lipoprotein export system ATPase subunit